MVGPDQIRRQHDIHAGRQREILKTRELCLAKRASPEVCPPNWHRITSIALKRVEESKPFMISS